MISFFFLLLIYYWTLPHIFDFITISPPFKVGSNKLLAMQIRWHSCLKFLSTLQWLCNGTKGELVWTREEVLQLWDQIKTRKCKSLPIILWLYNTLIRLGVMFASVSDWEEKMAFWKAKIQMLTCSSSSIITEGTITQRCRRRAEQACSSCCRCNCGSCRGCCCCCSGSCCSCPPHRNSFILS